MRPVYPPRPLGPLDRKQQLRKVASFEVARLREKAKATKPVALHVLKGRS